MHMTSNFEPNQDGMLDYGAFLKAFLQPTF